MLPRQKPWWTFPCLCRSLHLPHINLHYGQRETETKTLLVTCKWPKFLPLIHFLSFNKASAYFWLTNLPITLLLCPLLFLERGSRWQPSISLASTSVPDSLQMLITVFSKSSSQILFSMPDNSTLFLWLYCSPFAWFFSKFMILSSNLLFTFFVITRSLVSFLFSNEIWSIVSVSLCIWSDSLCKSVSTITLYLLH